MDENNVAATDTTASEVSTMQALVDENAKLKKSLNEVITRYNRLFNLYNTFVSYYLSEDRKEN